MWLAKTSVSTVILAVRNEKVDTNATATRDDREKSTRLQRRAALTRPETSGSLRRNLLTLCRRKPYLEQERRAKRVSAQQNLDLRTQSCPSQVLCAVRVAERVGELLTLYGKQALELEYVCVYRMQPSS